MMRRGVWKVFASAVLVFLFAAMSTHAAEESGNAATEHANEIFKWINFSIVAGLIAWVFLKLTPPFFRKNAETIISAITKATAAKSEADRHLREAEDELWAIGHEVLHLQATAQQSITVESG